MAKILIVDDDQQATTLLEMLLSARGYEAISVNESSLAVNTAIETHPDLIILDLMMPEPDGFKVCRMLRADARFIFTPILIITALDDTDSRIVAYGAGADDYLIKPFHLAELNARIKSLTRRVLFKGDNTITMNEIKINPDSHEVYIHGKLLDLTKKEFDLLLFLTINKDKVLSKESIAEHLWGDYIDSADSFDFVYAHIKNLRKKLIDHGVGNYLQTVYGVGYKFIEN